MFNNKTISSSVGLALLTDWNSTFNAGWQDKEGSEDSGTIVLAFRNAKDNQSNT